MKKYTSIDVEPIKNGWLISLDYEEKKGKETEYESDRVFCKKGAEVLEQVSHWFKLLKK